jgi:mannose-6-phosphate isomerase-like protein (cupin superfamily)
MANQQIIFADYETKETSYDKWVKTEGIEVIKGYAVDDLMKLPLKPWERKGGLGAFLNLDSGQTDDAYICEIPPGGSLKPQKHLFEELIYILSGRGTTAFWKEGGPQRIIEWREGSLFAPPLNTWHQHFNSQGDKPVRYIALTTAPTVINLFHNMEFIFENPFTFNDRYNSEDDYFGKERFFRLTRTNAPMYESNFIPDVKNFQLKEWELRGYNAFNMKFELAHNLINAHIAEWPVGTYMQAHAHRGGAHVLILRGEGYTLMWPEGEKPQKFPWHEGSLVVPPEMWFHQHFNTCGTPIRYLALRWGSRRYRMGNYNVDLSSISTKLGGRQIEFRDEDPWIRKTYEEELAKAGLTMKMPVF